MNTDSSFFKLLVFDRCGVLALDQVDDCHFFGVFQILIREEVRPQLHLRIEIVLFVVEKDSLEGLCIKENKTIRLPCLLVCGC
jgi:hypothetical protein